MWSPVPDTVQSLENHAARFLPLVKGQQRRAGGRFEDVVDTLARQRRALEVFAGSNLCCRVVAFFGRHELERLLAHLLDSQWIFAKIFLQPDQDDRHAWASFLCFADPLYQLSAIPESNAAEGCDAPCALRSQANLAYPPRTRSG